MHMRAVLVFSIVAMAVIGCGRAVSPDETVVATINGDPVYASELQRELALARRMYPGVEITDAMARDQLDMLINKRLLIQEAKRTKLDEADVFVRTIKAFWEQTLIRDLLNRKEETIAKTAAVTEKDTQAYYRRLSSLVTLDIFKDRDPRVVTKYAKVPPSSVPWNERLGPISYEYLSNGVIRDAFDLKKGESNIFNDSEYYYLIHMKDKTTRELRPYAVMAQDIAVQVENMKKQAFMDEWMRDLKKDARIDIKDAAVRGLKYQHAK